MPQDFSSGAKALIARHLMSELKLRPPKCEARFGKRALRIHSQVSQSRSLYQRPAAGRNQGRPL